MKSILISLLLIPLSWGSLSEMIEAGRECVTLANVRLLNQAAQIADVTGGSFRPEAQDVSGILDELVDLGHLTDLNRNKVEGVAGRLRPVRTFATWRDVEFAVKSGL